MNGLVRGFVVVLWFALANTVHAQPAAVTPPQAAPDSGGSGAPAIVTPPHALPDSKAKAPATIKPPHGLPDGAAPDSAELPASTTWSYEAKGTGVLWASARSDHGTLGEYCNGDVGFCVWILMLRGAQCIQGDYHPILLNTDQLAAPHIIRCVGSATGKGATFAFTDFQAINEAVRGAQQLAIAFPEEGDNIVVTHFPLTGATAALDQLRDAFSEKSETLGKDGEDSGEKPSSGKSRNDKSAPRNALLRLVAYHVFHSRQSASLG